MNSPTSTSNGFFDGYSIPDGFFDEYWKSPTSSRAHVSQFLDSVRALGQQEFSRLWIQAQRTLHENGFTFAGHVDAGDKTRPWELDALPLLIDSDEWQFIANALRQRATVLNLTLQDLYGEQKLLRSGVVPPEFVYSHPGFLRSCAQSSKGKEQRRSFLHFYAADLARSQDGSWWILNDRTEAPSGLGFMLENRLVISRMYPGLFQQLQVHRLAPFFMTMQETLQNLAPQRRENPHIVLLSNGPNSHNYFEDAFLARYLGYTLVEGGDLAVRNEQVLLKTLGGLLPVDVILRRQNSGICDPLEFDEDSVSGIAGIMQAVRNGNVGMANSFGSGLVESPAFLALMPALCQALLGEDLLIPAVASWWCGDRESLNYVLKNLDRVIIQPTFRSRGSDGVTNQSLSEMNHQQLRELILSGPSGYVAREKTARSCIPSWNDGLQPSYLALRGYVVAGKNGYEVLNGALARTSISLDPLEISIRKGEGSKDTWILAKEPVDHISLLADPASTTELRRGGAELPSRAADNFFWLGRQLERADSLSRLLRCTADRLSGETRATSDIEIPVLLRCLAETGQIEPSYAVDDLKNQLPKIESALPYLAFDPKLPFSLRSILDDFFRIGSIVRDRISLDSWRIIHQISETIVPAYTATPTLSDLLTLSNQVITELSAFNGVVVESMTRSQAFRFLDLGRRLERSTQIINLVGNAFIPLPSVQRPVLETVLEISDSLMTYRSRYFSNLHLAPVLDLLLTDESNPRSLAFQFVHLAEQVNQLPRAKTPGYNVEQKLAMTLLHSLRLLDVQQVADDHNLGDTLRLKSLFEEWKELLPRFGEAISHRYLVHSVSAHQLSEIQPQGIELAEAPLHVPGNE